MDRRTLAAVLSFNDTEKQTNHTACKEQSAQQHQQHRKDELLC